MSIYSTHWGRVTHICVIKLTIIGSDNGLSPSRRQAIIWTDVRILLIGPLGTNCSELLIEIIISSFKKMRLKVSSGQWRPLCLCLNVLTSFTFISRVCINWVSALLSGGVGVLTHLSGQVGRHFADDIFKYFSWIKKNVFFIKISLKFVLNVNLTITQHCYR